MKFKINNIKYKDFQGENYQFVIKTSHGLLDLYDINLNNEIIGAISINILNVRPTINANILLNNFEIMNNIDINSLLFKLPTFDGFFGNIKLSGKNIKFRKSSIETLDMLANINNGAINLKTFNIKGFGGECNITGFLNLLYNRKLNLTFNGCTGHISQILYLFTGIENINGIIGFSSVLYAEGFNLENFINSYILNTQIIGSGIIIKNFGLQTLSSNLFEINNNEELLNNINPNNILYDDKNQTVFEKISSGDIKYSKRNGGQFSFDVSRPLINGKITGNFELFSNYISIQNANANFTLLSGTLKSTIPLTILIAMSGLTPNINIVSNLDQINSYINSIKEQYELVKSSSTNAVQEEAN